MDKESLAVLKAQLLSQAGEINKIYDKLDDRIRGTGGAALESAGYQLHNLYCAFEDLFMMIAAAFENHIEDRSRFHMELARRMTLHIEGIRPRLLSEQSYLLADNLRSFRHLFRHAYSHEIDERKLRIVYDDAVQLRESFRDDLEAFIESLEKAC